MKYEIPWKEAVARIILEILEHRDYLKRRMFTGEDLADSYKRLGKNFYDNRSIRESTHKALQHYRGSKPCVIEFLGRIPPEPKYATYRVTDEGIKVLKVDAMSLEELQEVLERMEKEIEKKKKEIKEKNRSLH